MLHPGDGVGLCACSNGLKAKQAEEIAALKEVFSTYPLFSVESPCLYENGLRFQRHGRGAGAGLDGYV